MKAGIALLAIGIGLSLLMPPDTQAAEINAFVTGAARRSYDALAPQFERSTG